MDVFSLVRRYRWLVLNTVVLFPLFALILSATRAADSPASRAEPVNLIGSVRGAEGKEPIAGAIVYLYTAKPRDGVSTLCPSCYADCQKQVVSDANGTFTLDAVDSSLLFRVVVVCKGYQPTALDAVDPAKGEVEVALQKAGTADDSSRFTVQGRLVGPTGKPLAGALIEENAVKWGGSTGFGYHPTQESSVLTNEAGEFVFHCVRTMEDTDENGKKTNQPVTALQVMVKARDHARAKAWLKADTSEVQPITLTTGATVQGVVRGATGAPAPGVKVIISQKSRNSETFLEAHEIATGPDGVFLLPNVPQDDEYGVTVAMESLLPIGRAAPVQFFKIGKDEAEVRGISITLQAAGTITGRVVLPDNGPIPANTQINLSREDSWDSQVTTLGKNGEFTFRGIPPGETLSLFFLLPGYSTAPDNPNVKSWGSIEIKMPTPATTLPLTIRMIRDKKAP